MISPHVKQALLQNWGDKANALDCFVEVKFIDLKEKWKCYIYAMNPNDNDEICCLMVDEQGYELLDWSLKELCFVFDDNGEYPIIDQEFRRIHITQLLKHLKGE